MVGGSGTGVGVLYTESSQLHRVVGAMLVSPALQHGVNDSNNHPESQRVGAQAPNLRIFCL